MSGSCVVKLEPEESSMFTVSEDLITQSFRRESFLSLGCESESKIKCEVEFTDIKSPVTACSETAISLHCADSSDQLTDTSLMVTVTKQENSQEPSSALVFCSSSPLCNAEISSISSWDFIKKEKINETVHSSDDGPYLMNIKEEDKSDSETSDATVDISATQVADAESTTEQAEIDANQSPDNRAQLNRCPQCKKILRRFHDLKIHMQHVHQNERQYCCSQCKRSFSVESFLTRHMRRVHGDKKYDCDKCDYSSKYNHGLKKHVSAVHLEEKPHKCPKCDSCFSCKSNLMRHISVHNHEKPYECSACDMKFTATRSRDFHWRSVHCGEKPHSCDQCDYKCSQKGSLTKHQRAVHDGLRPFGCTQCEYKSSSKSNLNKHWAAVHCQQKPHLCAECNRAFSQASHLKAHVDAKHRRLNLTQVLTITTSSL